jgi:hypothetical protein
MVVVVVVVVVVMVMMMTMMIVYYQSYSHHPHQYYCFYHLVDHIIHYFDFYSLDRPKCFTFQVQYCSITICGSNFTVIGTDLFHTSDFPAPLANSLADTCFDSESKLC